MTLRNLKTAIAASVSAAILLGAIPPAMAAEPGFALPPSTSSYDPAGDSISNQDAYVTVPNGTLPCEGGVAVMQRAAAAANAKIAAVNEQADKVGREISAKRTCLENINALISFGIPTFPSLSAIVAKFAAAIINALINKACAVVVGAINGAVNTINKEIQGVKDQVMSPINDIRNQANGVGVPTSGGGNQYVTPGEVSSVIGGGSGSSSSSSAAKIGTGSSASTAARSAQVQQGAAPSSATARPAPATAPNPAAPASAPTPAWKAVSCKIFGGC